MSQFDHDPAALLSQPNGKYAGWNAAVGRGLPVIVTYSFADGAHLITPEDAGAGPEAISAFTAPQRENFRNLSMHFMEKTGVLLLETDAGGMIQIANMHGSGAGGLADIPAAQTHYSGTMRFLVDGAGDYDPGSGEYLTLLRGLTHALGLKGGEGGFAVLPVPSGHDTARISLTAPETEALQLLYGPPVDTGNWDIRVDPQALHLHLTADAADDMIFAPALDTWIDGGAGNDTLYGRERADVLQGGAGSNWIEGGHGADRIESRGTGDMLIGGAGADEFMLQGSRRFEAGSMAQNVSGAGQTGTGQVVDLEGRLRIAAVVDGGDREAPDTITLSEAGDALFLDDAFSAMHADTGAAGGGPVPRLQHIDVINARGGDDLIDLTSPDLRLQTGPSGLRIDGGVGHDVIWGSAGLEQISGGAGDDTLFGGGGTDILTGGAGADVFEFTPSGTVDAIMDFDPAMDLLHFYNGDGARYAADSLLLGSARMGIDYQTETGAWMTQSIDLAGVDYDLEALRAAIEIV